MASSEAKVLPYSRRRDIAAFWLALLFVVIWGANFSNQKWIYQSMSPGALLFLRYGVMMPVFALLLMLLVYRTHWPKLTRQDTWTLFKWGFVGHALHVSIVTWGIHWSTAFSSSLILAGGPVFTLLILRFVENERLARSTIAGAGVALIGALIFMSDKWLHATSGANTGSHDTKSLWLAIGGDLSLVAAAVLFSLYTVKIRPFIVKHGSVTVMCYATWMNCPIIAIAFAWFGFQVPWLELPARTWGALFYAVGLSAFLGWLAWGWANAVRGAARNAPMQYLMPPVSGLIAWLAGGEQFSSIKIAGALIAMAGVALAQFGLPKRLLNALGLSR